MLNIMLLAGTVGFPFSLNYGINDSWVADGWRVEEVARISLADYAEPMNVSNSARYECLVEVEAKATPSWSVVVGGERRIVLLRENTDPVLLEIEYDNYSLVPVLSENYVLIQSQMNQHLTAFRYSFETGDKIAAVTNRNGQLVSGNEGYFVSLMGVSGAVYFADYEGYLGGYTDLTGLVEYDASEGNSSSGISGHAISGDGKLFIVGLQRSSSSHILAGYSQDRSVIWEAELLTGRQIGISYDGTFVVVNVPTDGIALLDGRTGEVLASYLTGCQIRSLAISPNGRFIASSFSPSSSANISQEERLICCIDTQDQSDIENYLTYAECGVNSPIITEVADDGTFLVMNSGTDRLLQIILLNFSGELLWKSNEFTPYSNIVTQVAFLRNTLSSLANVEEGYIVGYLNSGSDEVVINTILPELGR